MAGPGGKRAGAGRKPGVPNKATRDLKALAQRYDSEAVASLVSVMRDCHDVKETGARVRAAELLLAYGHGRPKQQVDATVDGPITVVIRQFTPD
jgi:hypothetical protein